MTIGFVSFDELADRFESSLASTGSQFAAEVDLLCAFVPSEYRKIMYPADRRHFERWAAGSGRTLPALHLRVSDTCGRDTTDIVADLWFNDWRKRGLLLKEVSLGPMPPSLRL